jgi:hypothetical protein
MNECRRRERARARRIVEAGNLCTLKRGLLRMHIMRS